MIPKSFPVLSLFNCFLRLGGKDANQLLILSSQIVCPLIHMPQHKYIHLPSPLFPLLQIHHQHRHVRRGHSGHPPGLAQVFGTDGGQLLPGLQPQALNR